MRRERRASRTYGMLHSIKRMRDADAASSVMLTLRQATWMFVTIVPERDIFVLE